MRIICFIALFISMNSFSQEVNIKQFTGIWVLSAVNEDTQTVNYEIIGKQKKMHFEKYNGKYYFLKSERIGFLRKADVNSLQNRIYKKNGNLEEDYLMLGNNFECSLPEYNGGEITQMVLYNMNEFYYSKLTIVPQEIQKALFNEYKKSNKDYLFEFRGIDVREITVPKSSIYSFNKEITNSYLVKGDIVEVEAIGAEFVRISYNKDDEKAITGYVKYTDISKKAPIPSFDPEKAFTPIEKAICSDVVLASLDRQLAKAYKESKNKYGSEVKKTQIEWLKRRNLECKNKPQEEVVELLKNLYEERLNALRSRKGDE